MIKYWVLFFIVVSGCASVYRPVNPQALEYLTENSNEQVDFWYRYDALRYRGNKKYSKKERKHGFSIVAVKIINKTDRTLSLARDFEFQTARGPVYPAENQYTAGFLKQGVAIYLLYGLMGSLRWECDGNGNCDTSYIPWGLGIAAGNMIVAGTSNMKMRREFSEYSLYSKSIAPGETVYGIVALRDIGYQPLSLVLKKK